MGRLLVVPEIPTEDIAELEEPSEQTIRRLRWLAIGCLFLGAQSIVDSIYQGVVMQRWEILQIDWFLVGAAGGLLNGQRGWRTFVLVIAWLMIVLGTVVACFSFRETHLLSQANIPGYALLYYSIGGLCLLGLALLAAWTIRFLRQLDLKHAFFAEKSLSPPLSRKLKWICWITALLSCAALTAGEIIWNKDVRKRKRWAESSPVKTSGGVSLQAVEVLFLFGRTQEILLWYGEGQYNRTHRGSAVPPKSIFTTIELPDGRPVVIPGKVNVFEFIDGEYREAFLEITQEETEAFLDTDIYPRRIEDLEKFIAERRKKSSIAP